MYSHLPPPPKKKNKLLKLQGLEDDVLLVGAPPQPSAKKYHVFGLAD